MTLDFVHAQAAHDPAPQAAVGGEAARLRLPDGDPAVYAHTLQHLVAALLRDDATGLIRDARGGRLDPATIRAAAAALRALGVRPGDRVVVRAANDVQGAASILGVWLAGGVVCPLDPTAPDATLAAVAREAAACAAVAPEGAVTTLRHAAPAPAIARSRDDAATAADLAMIIFTSGSSGAPKGVMLTHGNVMASLRAIVAYLEIGPRDRVLCVPPMFLDYGIYQALFAMFARCELVLSGGEKNPLRLLALIREKRPTILPVIPALASGLARVLNLFGQVEHAPRLVTNTGGHLAPATVEALRRAFPGVAVTPMYGLTETKRALFLPPEMVDAKPGSVGGPMPGMDARVVVTEPDGSLREAADGEVGELWLRGASMMQGYHAPEATGGARIVPGRWRDDNWLATGDLFERDADGCLWFRGRSKLLIKQKGWCVYPRDLEAAAEAEPEVGSAVCVGREEADGDESAILFVVAPAVAGADAREALADRIRERLHVTLRPREIRFLAEWPASPVGKIDLGALREMARAAATQEG